MIRKLWRRYQQWRYKQVDVDKFNRRQFERDRRGYLANLQASLDAGLIDSETYDMKEAQWADR